MLCGTEEEDTVGLSTSKEQGGSPGHGGRFCPASLGNKYVAVTGATFRASTVKRRGLLESHRGIPGRHPAQMTVVLRVRNPVREQSKKARNCVAKLKTPVIFRH